SYSGDFAAELHRQFSMVIASEWYAAVFPNLHLAKETGLELVTSQGGSRYATSVGGTLTGRGADLIIVDDPLNANEIHSETARKRVIDWYGGALVSRLNDKQTGSIIAVMQRLHEDDLAGHLLRQGGWNHLNMPAIALEQSARAERPWRRSKQKWEACFSPPNISNSRCRSKAILSGGRGSRPMTTCRPGPGKRGSSRAGTSPTVEQPQRRLLGVSGLAIEDFKLKASTNAQLTSQPKPR